MYASSTAIAGFLLCHQSSLLITFHVNKLSLFSKSVCSTSSLVTRPQNFHCTPTPFKMTSYQFQLLNIISQESPLRDTTGASSVVVTIMAWMGGMTCPTVLTKKISWKVLPKVVSSHFFKCWGATAKSAFFSIFLAAAASLLWEMTKAAAFNSDLSQKPCSLFSQHVYAKAFDHWLNASFSYSEVRWWQYADHNNAQKGGWLPCQHLQSLKSMITQDFKSVESTIKQSFDCKTSLHRQISYCSFFIVVDQSITW